LKAAADELPIKDFERMLGSWSKFEIVTGPSSIHAIGCEGKSKQAACLPLQ
jgi:hypothetical protein